MLEDKCKQLNQDNTDYVRQLIDMKEKMAKGINDVLSGSSSSGVKNSLVEEAKNIQL